jgi:adenylate kinase
MNICLIGPSGSGKGTQAAKLMQKFDLVPLITGELLRKNIENHTAIGYLADLHVRQGELVPDDIVNAMVSEWLWRIPDDQNILFDGYPRTLEQAQFIDQQLHEGGRKLDTVIYLQAADDVVMSRLAGRLTCSSCGVPYHSKVYKPTVPMVCDLCGSALEAQKDDIAALVRVRLRAFKRSIRPIITYYEESERVIILDANEPLERVSELVLAAAVDDSKNSFQHFSKTDTALRELVNQGTNIESARDGFNLILIGGPGSGKGTQAEYLQNHFSLLHLSTGSLFRENLNNNSDLGKLAKSFMNKGKLVPDDITEAMVEERLTRDDTLNGFILDGFPRTLAQTYALTEIMNSLHRSIDGVVYIRVTDAEIVRRISGRLICSNCQTPFHVQFNPPSEEGVCDRCGGSLYQRDDDNVITVQTRLKTFHSQTAPIVDFYREAGILIEINGEGEVNDIVNRSKDAVEALMDAQKAQNHLGNITSN